MRSLSLIPSSKPIDFRLPISNLLLCFYTFFFESFQYRDPIVCACAPAHTVYLIPFPYLAFE